MNLPTTRLRVRRMWWLIAVAVAPLACRDPLSRFTYGVKLQNEPLPPGVNPDPTQFRGQVAARGGPGPSHVHMRLGKCASPCLVEVTIAPVGDTREANPASPLIPASGRVVAKILNLDTLYREDMYGFRPSLLFEYYVWTDTSASQARLTLLEVPAVGQPGSVQAIFQKNIQLCLRDPSMPNASDADFKYCAGLIVATPGNLNEASMLPFGRVMSLLSRTAEPLMGKPMTAEAPIWLRCKDGCCG